MPPAIIIKRDIPFFLLSFKIDYNTAKKFLLILMVNVPGTYIMFTGKIYMKLISPSEAPVNIFSASAQDPIWRLLIAWKHVYPFSSLVFRDFCHQREENGLLVRINETGYLFVFCYSSKTNTRCYIQASFAM